MSATSLAMSLKDVPKEAHVVIENRLAMRNVSVSDVYRAGLGDVVLVHDE